jgi:RNA polymerase sigma factor (sigma-70 family)
VENEQVPEYDRLFRAEYPQILHAAHLVVGDVQLAREATQDAFVELFVRWRRIRRYDKPGAWVRRVAIRKALRARRREVPVGLEPVESDRSNWSDAATVDVHRALVTLSPQQRAAVVLFYLYDMPVDAAATALGCRPSTLRVHLHRARSNLRRAIGEETVL